MANWQRWTGARDVALAILGWLAIGYIAFIALGYLFHALLLLVLGALLAYVLTPLIGVLARRMPRGLAVAFTYAAALGLLATLGYAIIGTAVAQGINFAQALPDLLAPVNAQHPAPLYRLLNQLGISYDAINQGRVQLIAWAQGAAVGVATRALPIVTGVLGGLVDVVLVVVISVYLVIDGQRVVRWLRTRTPASQRDRVAFLLDVLDRNVGGYVRGELLLATLIGVLVGAGMFMFRLPYPLLLGVLAAVLELVPILGVFVSGAICVLVALAHGWPVAVGVLVYFVGVHVVEGDVVGPRIIGRALGLHPVVAIVALVAGADRFGLWGALFAAPVAGVLQAVLVALWAEWREGHPEEFPAVSAAAGPTRAVGGAGADLADAPMASGGAPGRADVPAP